VTRIFILMFLFSAAILAQNTKNMVVVDDAGRSILRMLVVCEYKLVLKDPKDKEVKITLSVMGNGFFAGDHLDFSDFVVTASHLFECNSSIGELVSKGILNQIDQTREEDLSVDNIVALKDGKVENIRGYTFAGDPVLDIQILFNAPSPKMLNDPDKALLRVSAPSGIIHSHFPLMDDKVFDEIFFKENIIGKEVVVRGFLLYNGGWFLRYRNALIEWTRSEVFQINELLDHGLSGSPVLYLHEGKTYSIGVVSHGPFQQSSRNFDMSWITIVKKNFLNSKNKK